MWRWKYLMAGRKFDLKNRKIIWLRSFPWFLADWARIFTSVSPIRSGQLTIPREKMNKISVYRWCFAKLFRKIVFRSPGWKNWFHERHCAYLYACNVVENKNVVSVLDSLLNHFVISFWLGNYIRMYACLSEILCCLSLHTITSIHHYRAIYCSL